MARMFIRRTRTNNTATGEGYFTFRLVRGERIAGKVRQITVLNLGRHFPVLQEHWPLLCSRIEQLLAPQTLLCALSCPDHIERAAQRYADQLIGRSTQAGAASAPSAEVKTDFDASANALAIAAPMAAVGAPDMQMLDIESLQYSRARSVGVEHVALHAIAQLGLVAKLTALGVNAVAQACILGNLIGRIAAPGSELATWEWLQTHSSLGELLDVDFEGLSHMRLYRA